MKNIVIITDSAKIADVEFKALRQKLMNKDLLIKSDARYWTLYTKQVAVFFWSVNSPMCSSLFDTIAYANCKIGIKSNEPIMSQIRKWQRIEQLIENMPPYTEEIPYIDIENLKIWGSKNGEVSL